MTHPWTERLSDYLDGELEERERLALEAHLAECAECGAVLADLRRVVRRARTLADRPPERDLWPAIAGAAGIGSRRRGERRIAFSLPQLLAASIALLLLGGGATWLGLSRGDGRPGEPVAVAPADSLPAMPAPRPVRFGRERYDSAVAELSRILAQHRERLDTTTVRVLEENLRVIDDAIAQAQRALEADPANPYLNGHLAQTMQRKLELLRRVAAVTATAS